MAAQGGRRAPQQRPYQGEKGQQGGVAAFPCDNQRGFYEEMLKALWGYIGDKLNIPSSNLTKENVREELVKRGVSPEAAQKYIDIIVECEYAQYAPAATGRMTEVYGAGVEMVSRLESIIGK